MPSAHDDFRTLMAGPEASTFSGVILQYLVAGINMMALKL